MNTFSNYLATIAVLILAFSNTHAQPAFIWAKQQGGPANERAMAVVTDASGNVYTTGYFQGTADFDPGAGTFTMTASPGGVDIYVSKLDASGTFQWAKQIQSGGTADHGRAITLDNSGNVIITGDFQGSKDFDPGVGVTTLAAAGNTDIFVLKLTATGNFVMAKSVGDVSGDYGYAITTDASGNIYTTGSYVGTADFDPSAGTFTMNAANGNQNTFIWKLDASGNFVWARQFVHTTTFGSNAGQAIKVDAAGDVCVSGVFTQQADFDTGAGTYTINAVNMDMYFVKLLASNGNMVWAKAIGGAGGNTNSNSPLALAIDASNNWHATGYFGGGATDFDPGAGSYTLSSNGANDVFVVKLSSSGNLSWAKSFGGVNSDIAYAIGLDAQGNVYTVGDFNNSADFDPGPAVYTATINGNGVFVSKLDASGNFVSVSLFGQGNPTGRGVSLTPFSEIYVAGGFDTQVDFDPGAGTYTMSPTGGGYEDIYVLKLGQSVCPTFSVNSSTSSFTLMCSITSLTLNAVNTSTISGVTYTWTAPTLNTATGSAYTSTTAGVYTVTASAPSNTCVVTQTLSVYQTTGNVNFNVNTTGVTCLSNGSASITVTSGSSPYTFTWSSGGNSSTTGGLAVGIYTATVTDAILCSASKTFAVNNIAQPFASVPICFVSVDSLSQNNVITWDKTQFPNADSFYVYREIASNTYSVIQRQKYSSLSRFVDTVKTMYYPNTGNPNVGTYRYKLKTVDSCGNFSTFSPYHNTLFIVNNNGTFSWPQLYAVEGSASPVVAYVLERDNNSTGNWQAVGSVAATQQFIIDPAYGTYQNTARWRVRTQWNIFSVPTLRSAFNSSSFSNQISNLAIGIKENVLNTRFTIYPQPASHHVSITTEEEADQLQLKVIDVNGKLVMSENIKLNNHKAELNVTALARGVYILELTCNNKTAYKKLTITD